MFLHKIGTIYYIHYRDLRSGKMNKKSTGEKNKQQAEKKLSTFKVEYLIAQQKPPVEAEPVLQEKWTWLKLKVHIINYFKSQPYNLPIVNYAKMFDNFQGFLELKYKRKEFLLNQITALDFEEYKQYRVKQVSPTSVNTELAFYKSYLNRAHSWGFLSNHPFNNNAVEFFQIPEREMNVFTVEEIEAILNSAKFKNIQHYFIFKFALLSGCRLSEVLNLKWEQVRFDKNEIIISSTPSFATKTRRNRIIPISAPLKEFFQNEILTVFKPQADKYVFSNKNMVKYNKCHISTAFKKYITELGLNPKYKFHSMRATYINFMNRLGANAFIIQKCIGHASINTTLKYVVIEQDSILKYSNQLDYRKDLVM